MVPFLLCPLIALGFAAYAYRFAASDMRDMQSRPIYYALYAGGASFGVLSGLWVAISPLPSLAAICVFLLVGGLSYALLGRYLRRDFPAHKWVEKGAEYIMFGMAGIAILTMIGIVMSLLFEAIRFFSLVPLPDFLFGLKWSPQTAIRTDQVANIGSFGAVPLFLGTILISSIAMFVAIPIGLLSAIYLAEYAPQHVESIAKPLLEIFAGIPTVVYGFFAVIMIAPAIRTGGEFLGLSVASESALAAGLVMGIMIIPFMSSLSNDALRAVPASLREAAYALGATKSETIRQVLLPAAFGGVMGAVLLAVSRAIGETMIVVMAAGLAANLTANPLDAVTTITVQMVTLLVGDQEFDSAKTLAAFALGLVLFFLTLFLNMAALWVRHRYREAYE